MKSFLTASTALLTFCGALTGQEPSVIKTNILTYAPAGLPGGFRAFYKTAKSVFEFRASAGNLGTPVLYEGPRQFTLRADKKEFDLPPDKLKDLPPIAFVNLPAHADTALILCIPEAEEKIRLVAYDVSSDTLRRGTYRVFNFSSKPLSIILGDQRFSVTPRSDKSVDDSGWHKETIALPMRIATIADNKPTLVYSSFWEHYPQRRNLLFLFNGKHPSDPVIFSSFDVDTPPRKIPAARTP